MKFTIMMRWVGEMGWWVRALVPAEDTGLILSAHMIIHNYPQLQFQGPQWPLLTSTGTGHTYSIQTHMKQNIHAHKNIHLK